MCFLKTIFKWILFIDLSSWKIYFFHWILIYLYLLLIVIDIVEFISIILLWVSYLSYLFNVIFLFFFLVFFWIECFSHPISYFIICAVSVLLLVILDILTYVSNPKFNHIITLFLSNTVSIKHLIISLLKCIIFGMHFRFISSLNSVTEYYYYL